MPPISVAILICGLITIVTVMHAYRIHRLSEHIDLPEDLADDIVRAADHLTWWAFTWGLIALALAVVKYGPFA